MNDMDDECWTGPQRGQKYFQEVLLNLTRNNGYANITLLALILWRVW